MILKRRIKSLLISALLIACSAGSALDAERHQVRANDGMPEQTGIDQPVKVEGGPRQFQTAHFEFETDQKVSKGFISQVAQVFEGTYRAIAALPMGIEPSPPDGMQRFKARFMKRATFDSELAGRIQVAPGMQLAGVYLASQKEILVPYSSIGAMRRRGQMTLRRTSDTTTLIHEITHQVMHDWLPLLPPWMFEGMAEYIAAIPYQNGRFEFRNAARGLKERLVEIYRTDAPRIQNPVALVKGNGPPWSNTAQHYLTGMMMIYYFVHLDGGGQGEALSAYLSLLKQARDDTDRFIRDYNEALKYFEYRRLAYEKEFDIYNTKFAAYRARVQERNRLVAEYNAQIESGVPVDKRVTVPSVPNPPKAPLNLVVPKILEETPQGGDPIDVLAVAEAKARPSLLRGRGDQALARDMIRAFKAIGVQLRLESTESRRTEDFSAQRRP